MFEALSKHNLPADDWAATFRLRGVNLVYEEVLCDYTTGCEAFSFMTEGHGIF